MIDKLKKKKFSIEFILSCGMFVYPPIQTGAYHLSNFKIYNNLITVT